MEKGKNAAIMVVWTGAAAMLASMDPSGALIGLTTAGLGNLGLDMGKSIAANMLTEPVQKIQGQVLQRLYRSGNPEDVNHDLFKAFQQAAVEAMDDVWDHYRNHSPDQDETHLEAVRKKIERIKQGIRDRLVQHMGDIEEQEIRDFAENKTMTLAMQVEHLALSYELHENGKHLEPIFRKVFAEQLLFQFGEQLKHKPPAWVAYQRLTFAAITQQSSKILFEVGYNQSILVELRKRLDTLEQPDIGPELLAQHAEAAAKWDKHFEDLKRDVKDVKGDVKEVSDDVKEVKVTVNEINKKLEAREGFRLKEAINTTFLNINPGFNEEEFVGRKEDLKALEKLIDSQSTVALINGMGGVGKSTLARKYVADSIGKYHYILWLEQNAAIFESFRNAEALMQRLGMQADDTVEAQQQVQTMMHALGKMDRPSLLVIDNAEADTDQSVFKQMLPAGWKVLLTSRNELSYATHSLHELGPAEAASLFKLHCDIKGTEEELHSIFELIGYNTLSIELLAKTLSKQHRLEHLSQVLGILKGEGLQDKKLLRKIKTTHAGDREIRLFPYLVKVFNIADLDEQELHLLRYLSILPSIDTPLKDLLEILNIPESEEEQFVDRLQKLVQLGWVQKVSGHVYWVHRLIQRLINAQNEQQEEDLVKIAAGLGSLLRIDQNLDNPVEKFKWLSYSEPISGRLDVFGPQVNSLSILGTHKI